MLRDYNAGHIICKAFFFTARDVENLDEKISHSCDVKKFLTLSFRRKKISATNDGEKFLST